MHSARLAHVCGVRQSAAVNCVPMDHVARPVSRLLGTFPRVAGIIGACLAVLLFGLAFAAWTSSQKLPPKPERLTLQTVANNLATTQQVWAIVSDPIDWNCSSLRYNSVGGNLHTSIVFTSQNREIIVIESLTKQLTCEELMKESPSGVFDTPAQRQLDVWAAQGLNISAYPPSARVINLCNACSRDTSRGLTLILAILGGLCLTLYPLALWANRKSD